MFRYFRHIRKSLIEDLPAGLAGNKIRTYLLYAVGEILLVVIGILIALQINNWNQNRIDRTNEEFYLVNLRNDLELQIEEFQRTIESEDSVAYNLRVVGEILNDDPGVQDVAKLNIILSNLMANRSVNIYDATFEDLQSTGNIKLISNPELRQGIVEFYQAVDRADRVLVKNEGFKSDAREHMIDNSLVHFNVDYSSGLTQFLRASGIPVRNPILDPNDKFNFNHTVMSNLRDEQGILKLSNILTSRYLSSLVSVAVLTDRKDLAENLMTTINKYIEK